METETPIRYKAGCCQDPSCETCKGQTIPALPPEGYCLSQGSISRDVNRDLPHRTETPESSSWTEHEEAIFHAIMVEQGGTRMNAIRRYCAGAYRNRRFCASTAGEGLHYLPKGSTNKYCDNTCRYAQ